jgi:hypothetical protein
LNGAGRARVELSLDWKLPRQYHVAGQPSRLSSFIPAFIQKRRAMTKQTRTPPRAQMPQTPVTSLETDPLPKRRKSMRKTLALSALLAIVAAFWTGCASDNTKSTNAPANSAAAPVNSSAAPMNTNPSVTNTSASQAPKTAGSAPPSGIKPPMKDEKKK